jgi:hypothetical protein
MAPPDRRAVGAGRDLPGGRPDRARRTSGAEVVASIAELVHGRDEDGHRLVWRNGDARSCTILTVAGAVEIPSPWVDDRWVGLGQRAGLSVWSTTRLTKAWPDEHRTVPERDLSDRDVAHGWADGDRCDLRLEEDQLCSLVIVDVRRRGATELVVGTDGYRESKGFWIGSPRDLRRRGMRAPVSAVGSWGAEGRLPRGTRAARLGP